MNQATTNARMTIMPIVICQTPRLYRTLRFSNSRDSSCTLRHSESQSVFCTLPAAIKSRISRRSCFASSSIAALLKGAHDSTPSHLWYNQGGDAEMSKVSANIMLKTFGGFILGIGVGLG